MNKAQYVILYLLSNFLLQVFKITQFKQNVIEFYKKKKIYFIFIFYIIVYIKTIIQIYNVNIIRFFYIPYLDTITSKQVENTKAFE